HWGYRVGFVVSAALTLLFLVAISYLFAKGVGIWGINQPVSWAFALTNFVWWVGIGHAGTFISAFLLLLRQRWRTSINRFAEAMTIFAVAMAGLMPILHLGRPWFFYWLIPYPNIMNLWPQWRSPLVWDIFAISTYIIVSILFWYMGLIPDLATLRDSARARWKQVAYGLLALGWRGEARHWHRFDTAYLLLVCCLIVTYSYLMEIFMAFYSAEPFDIAMTMNRMRGPYAPLYWSVVLCNVVIPQALWFARVRASPWSLFMIAIVVNIGMW